MTFWDMIDRQLSRLDARGIAGAGIFVLTIVILWMIGERPALAQVDLFKVIAQAIIVQGLVGLAMASWFTRRGSPGDGKDE